MCDYKALLGRLYKLNRGATAKYDLRRMRALCAYYGNPETAFDCVHVTGTNGKGSVTFKLGEVLRENGLRTGVFQSPHVTTFRERVAVDGAMVEEAFVAQFVRRVLADIDRGRVQGSFFEVLTLLAFSYFRERRVDVACVEVGIGGRLDATNVLSRSLLSIVTAVGLDHCELLGDTCEAIAREKCGIIRPGSAALAGPSVPADVFREACAAVGAEAHVLSAAGDNFEEANIRLVEKAVGILRARGLAVPRVEGEWLRRRLPCRMEAVPPGLLATACAAPPRAAYLDVGHNPQAMAALLEAVTRAHPHAPIFMVYGTSSKKDVRSALSHAAPRVALALLVEARTPRAKSVGELAAVAEEVALPHRVVGGGGITATLTHLFAREHITDGVVVICGSFFIMEEARHFLGFDDLHDPFFLNELDLPGRN